MPLDARPIGTCVFWWLCRMVQTHVKHPSQTCGNTPVPWTIHILRTFWCWPVATQLNIKRITTYHSTKKINPYLRNLDTAQIPQMVLEILSQSDTIALKKHNSLPPFVTLFNILCTIKLYRHVFGITGSDARSEVNAWKTFRFRHFSKWASSSPEKKTQVV